MVVIDKKQEFLNDFQELLNKYGASFTVTDGWAGWDKNGIALVEFYDGDDRVTIDMPNCMSCEEQTNLTKYTREHELPRD